MDSRSIDSELYEEAIEHIEALREITRKTGVAIQATTHINQSGEAAAKMTMCNYLYNRFFDGHCKTSYNEYTINTDQVVFGGYPIGLEQTMELKALKKDKK